jgi:hypothetical protein
MKNRMRKTNNKDSLVKRLKILDGKIRHMQRKDKFTFFNQKFSSHNPRIIWKNVNNYLCRRKDNSINVLKYNDLLYTEHEAIADIFNSHFTNNTNSLADNVFRSSQNLRVDCLSNSFALLPIDEHEIYLAIMKIKSSSPDIHNISAIILKHLACFLIPILHLLFNSFIELEYIPKSIKQSVVFCLNKSGKKEDISDYRYISIGSSILKIFELILLDRMSRFVSQNNLISRWQFGFRPQSSTECALLELVTMIRTGIDKKQKISCVFIDLKAAFDMIDRKILIQVLERLGFRGKVNKLLHSYLHERGQAVNVNGKISRIMPTTFGVPQGSVMSPLLFSLFINSLTNLKLKGKLILYADDIVLINSHKINDNIQEYVKNDMIKIMSHLSSLRLLLNYGKTKLMIFQSAKTRRDTTNEITMDGNILIERVISFKYLGVLLDENLKFDKHINTVETKVAQSCGALWKLKFDLPRHIKEKLYFGLINSHLTYGNIVWGNSADTDICSLQIMQNRAIRNIYNIDSRTNRISLYSNLAMSFLPMRAINFYTTAIFIHKILHNKIHTNIELTRAATVRSRTSNRTSSMNILTPSITHTAVGSKSISHQGTKMYNEIDKSITDINNLENFKNALKKYLHEKIFLERCFNGDYIRRYC